MVDDIIVSLKTDLIVNEIILKMNRHEKMNQLGLLNGEFGILLFLFYYARYSNQQKYLTIAERYAEDLLTRLPKEINSTTYCSGLAGILYLFDYLREKQFIDIDVCSYKTEFELSITSVMKKDLSIGNYDFIHGAIGEGLYFLNHKTNDNIINCIIDVLYDLADKDDGKTVFKWRSIIDSRTLEIGYNIALSHGISSIVLFLCNVIKSGVNNEKLDIMLKGSVNFILSQCVSVDKYGCYFPSYSLDHPSTSFKSRLAWCYGDLGVAMALLQASKLLLNTELQKFALEVLVFSTNRISYQDSFVNDAGICHGSAGIAMIYNRLYIDTNIELFKNARDYWLSITLNYSWHKDGLAGYKTVFGKDFLNDYSLLTGISGIGLVLLSYLSNDYQDWDKLFLLS